MAETEIRDNEPAQRIEIWSDGQLGGFVTYRRRDDVVTFIHTEIEEAMEGRGLGSLLVRGALGQARERGYAVHPICPFVRAYIDRHREWVDLVPVDIRSRFGLDPLPPKF